VKNCGTCKFWTKNTQYYGASSNEGKCSELSNKVTIDVRYGWDGGYIAAYETEEDFGCVLWQHK